MRWVTCDVTEFEGHGGATHLLSFQPARLISRLLFGFFVREMRAATVFFIFTRHCCLLLWSMVTESFEYALSDMWCDRVWGTWGATSQGCNTSPFLPSFTNASNPVKKFLTFWAFEYQMIMKKSWGAPTSRRMPFCASSKWRARVSRRIKHCWCILSQARWCLFHICKTKPNLIGHASLFNLPR